MTDSFSRSPQQVIAEIGPNAVTLLEDYFDGKYSGAYFDLIGDRDSPNRFTARDLVAPSTLAVPIRGQKIWQEVLVTKSETFNDLLSQIPTAPIWAVGTEDLDRDSAAWKLWDLLLKYKQIGPTRVSKLMAVKRPELLPIYDSVILRVLGGYTGSFWLAMREAMLDQSLRRRLHEMRADAGRTHLSLLRALDILLWMHGTSPSEREQIQAKDAED